ncbi:MAG: PTS system mannose/fructose/sorbose family transporter subunit IID [bacterium]|nr:PTS system mannose/fructose/sorbose family transporter subunit IID [bacterium]
MLLRTFFRSFFIQSVWNFESMLSVGFAYILLPTIRKLYPDQEARKEALSRHLEFFNTNPYLAGPIIGLTIAKEESLAGGEEGVTPEEISILKTSMMGPLAVIGDNLFWATWRPLTAFLGVILVWSGSILGPVLFLVFYNSLQIPLRYFGIKGGYTLGEEELLQFIKRLATSNILPYLKLIALIFVGIVIGSLTEMDGLGLKTVNSVQRIELKCVSAGLIGIIAWSIHKGFSPTRIFALIVGASILGGYL